jgi:hypothetical protein
VLVHVVVVTFGFLLRSLLDHFWITFGSLLSGQENTPLTFCFFFFLWGQTNRLAHGTSFLLQDRLFKCSDEHEAHVCRRCGSILAPHATKPNEVGGTCSMLVVLVVPLFQNQYSSEDTLSTFWKNVKHSSNTFSTNILPLRIFLAVSI